MNNLRHSHWKFWNARHVTLGRLLEAPITTVRGQFTPEASRSAILQPHFTLQLPLFSKFIRLVPNVKWLALLLLSNYVQPTYRLVIISTLEYQHGILPLPVRILEESTSNASRVGITLGFYTCPVLDWISNPNLKLISNLPQTLWHSPTDFNSC